MSQQEYTDKAISDVGMFIIDVLRHDDIENINSIINLLNDDGCIGWRCFRSEDFTKTEILEQLAELIQRGLVTALHENRQEAGDYSLVTIQDITDTADSIWFALTEAGWQAWNTWSPPQEDR